jgi:acyl-CoA oxidase
MDGFTGHVMEEERRKATFDVEKLRKSITKGKDEIYAKYLPLFSSPLFDQDHDDQLSYEEGFKKKIERVTEAFNIIRNNPSFMFAHMKQKVQMEDYFEHNGIFLHFTMMLNYIKAQGTPEQQKYWMGKAREGDFIAAYAQTELGHGSNVRGLETTATLDIAKQEWEIHSPTLTSLKWWPTGMYACTHALVFAQLIIKGVSYGFHGFMVQLRQADGKTMPGVELGEIGPKLNFTSNNIGYCRFTRVRIPMNRMFSKHSKVTPAGQYIAAPKSLSKFRYISMMLARTSIVRVAYTQCAKAATIAIRYSAVRLQGFKPGSSTEENFVLDYQMQQYRTFRALALAYCLLWNSRYIHRYIKRVQGAIQDGDEHAADDLPELHATLSGLKATSTVKAHESIEECRKCCGGQGFLLSSGIAKLAPDFSEWVTVEGEQVILSLQCARFLIKAVHTANEGKPMSATIAYIGESDRPIDFSSPAGIIEALKIRARHLARRLTERFDASRARGMNFEDALNSVAVLACKASEAHVESFMLINNLASLEMTFENNLPTKRVMIMLLELQGLQTMSEKAGDFVGLLSESDVVGIDTRIASLLNQIRPNAVGLVDGFGFRDTQLKSTIGRYDGKVYEAIYEKAKSGSLNTVEGGGMIGWDKYSTVLDLNFLKETAKTQYQRPSSKL